VRSAKPTPRAQVANNGSAAQPVRVIEQQQLHQHPTHRHAYHVRLVDTHSVQHADHVFGQVAYRIGVRVEGPRSTVGVAVVVAHDPVLPSKPSDQRFRPGRPRWRSHP